MLRLRWRKVPETTENYHRIPVSSGHGSHAIKTITISAKDGIKALYCTDCKKIITYLFDTDKWSMSEAKEWVESHKDDMLGAENMKDFIDMRTKEAISSNVRYKSYGTFIPKGAAEDGDEMLVRGFFTSDEIDEVGDIITKEATVAAVEKWRKWGNIRTMHSNPSGRVDKIGESDGLAWNELVTVPVDQQTKELIKGGVLKAYSVGIIPRSYEINEEAMKDNTDPWFMPLIIHEYDMVEISYVDHPANYAAAISEVSSNKEMSHRAVLFKRGDLMGDIIDMDEMENGAVEAEQEEDVLESESVEESVDEPESVPVEEPDVLEAGAEEPESEEEDVVDKDEQSEFDVALAVSDIKGAIAGLDERVSSISEALESLVDRVVERFMDAMSAEPEGNDSDADAEDSEPEDVSPKMFDEDAFVTRVAEKVLEGLAEVLVPEATRKARVTVDDDDEADGDEDVDQTRVYLGMPTDDRRAKMKEIVNELRKYK